ncbi:MAG: methyltransferase domain-containing protein [Candidatus Micrarchaeota archaeon]|nr:methyltransferase domain-containing protein [Candidatus Micrarchaeota archaeon]MDE1824439.1 methyltransferase domain-containing protein [Candidatus Micrarchaeota archaeon]MDE1850107.1 methyltransferase domain-containing protein [Candidatus Micrarchaeota archaeon]
MFVYPREYRKLKRGPQVILPKDIGMIIAFSGISKSSVCVDAGTGSGWLALSLARLCSHVYSYDIRKEFIELAERNCGIWNISNITFRNQDVTKKLEERNVDLVCLDLPSSEKALANAKKALKENGCVVGYLPHTEQAKRFVERLERLGFADIYTIETIVRDMLVRKEGVRPSTKGIWHTAYLVFARKPQPRQE